MVAKLKKDPFKIVFLIVFPNDLGKIILFEFILLLLEFLIGRLKDLWVNFSSDFRVFLEIFGYNL